jgi:hypothetical protein
LEAYDLSVMTVENFFTDVVDIIISWHKIALIMQYVDWVIHVHFPELSLIIDAFPISCFWIEIMI